MEDYFFSICKAIIGSLAQHPAKKQTQTNQQTATKSPKDKRTLSLSLCHNIKMGTVLSTWEENDSKIGIKKMLLCKGSWL